jgi:subtilisin family serine protease/subtilisin-like proprotein convertase family protein
MRFGRLSLASKSRSRRRPIRVESLEPREVPAAAPFDALAVDPTWYDASTLLVQTKPGPIQLTALGIPSAASVRPLSLVPGLWEVQLAAGSSAAAALMASRNNPLIEQVSFNYRVGLTLTPDDPRYAEQWAWNNTGQNGGTLDADIDAPEAWNVFTGSANTVVAVIDTGVDYTHPDLAGNIWVNADEVAGNGIDDDGNGYVDDIHGYDFANNDSNPMDDHSHGTHVAGTIGALGNNNRGVTGINWAVRIMALKFLDASGNGTVANAIRALDYAVANGATISNNSYGGSAAEDADALFLQAIQSAAAQGHVFVAGAGNSSSNNDTVGFFPASFNADNILSVAATDRNDALASFSNYGPGSVHLAAPGVDILSTVPNNGYASNSGTSMATPHVAGVVALVRGLHPEWTYRQVIDQILNSVDFAPGLDGRVLTGGRLNAARALLDVDGPRVVASDPAGGVGGVVSKVRLSFNEPVDQATFGVADIASFAGPNGPITVTSVSPVAGSFNRQFDLTFAPQVTRGAYQLVVGPQIADRTGNLMDQDADGVLGEPTADQFTAAFTIGDQHVFNSTDTPKGLAALAFTRSTLAVASDIGIADLDVRINISAPDVGWLSVTLIAPSGARSTLVSMTGTERGPEFSDTVFSDEAAATINGGTSPYTGSFRPETPLSVVDGQSALGTWTLEILSLFGGTLNGWSLLAVATPPRITVDDVKVAEGNSGTTPAEFTVRLSNPIDTPVTVDFATAEATATAGDDYDPVTGTVTFAPGETVKTIVVPVRGDTVDELDESVLLNLTNPTNATLSDAQAVGTITNDERTVAIGDVNVTEVNSGNVIASFPLTLSAASDHVITVTYTAAPGTATTADYVPVTGTITFQPGQTTRTADVSVRGDNRYERSETFLVNITAEHALVTDGQGVGTILNDDPVPVMTVSDPTVVEGNSGTKNLVFGVNLSGPSDAVVTVNYATGTGTASAGADYTPVSGTLTFNPGATGINVNVPIAGDTDLEPSETIPFHLSAVGNAILMDGLGVGTILTDDQTLTVDDVAVVEPDGGTFAVNFTVRLSVAVPFEVRVNYATANGTAGAGADYVGAAGTVTFAPGETAKAVTVLGMGDIRNEAQETFFLNLAGAVNATIADTQGRATIDDTDPLPAVSIGDAVVVEGVSGTRLLNYTVTLSAISGQNVTVNFATADGTAVAGEDYGAGAGPFTIGAGNKSRVLQVVVSGDTATEADESVLVALSNPVNATLEDGDAVGTIQDDDSLVVGDIAATEGDFGAGLARIPVRLLAPRTHAVTVDYTTANGTAAAGADYIAQTGTLTFAPGETEKYVDVVVVGDRGHEADETFFLRLSNATGALIADTQGTATIANEDEMPTVTVSDALVVEGPSGARNAVFTVTLSRPSGQGVSIPYSTADGSATTANADYQPRTGTFNFGAGVTVATLGVPVNGDAAVEGDETFVLNLTGATNATLADSQGVATVIDDDPLPAVSVSDAVTSEGNAGTKTLNFTVSLSAASTQTVTVQVSTADNSATAGSDYTAMTQTVTFAPGQTSRTASVILSGDSQPEASETFFVNLADPTSAVLGDAQGTGTIQNEDSTLRVSDTTLTEGDDGTTTATFTISLTGALPGDPVTVGYYTSNGTAGAPLDYIAQTGTLTFAPGETARTVEVLVVGDRWNEISETFNLNLQNPVSAAIADAVGVATILDNADPVPMVSVFDAAISEGASGTKNLTFTVRLSAPSGKTVTATYGTANGTAVAGTDYQARTGVVTIGAGAMSQTVTVPLNGDTASEADETFLLTLTNPANATLADDQAIGTILDDDSLVVDDVTVAEGDAGPVVAKFTVRLLTARDHAVSVNYATANGTAGAGADFVTAAGGVTFAPGETSKPVEVTVVGDRLDEANETFLVVLSNAVGALIADDRGTGTVTDDDATPSVSVTDVVIAEGNTGTKSVTFVVTLSEPSGQGVTVHYATADGTASATGGDYVARTGSFTFNAGAVSQAVTVTLNGDMAAESNETFVLNLTGVTNGTLADGQGVATIIDDDGTLGGLSGGSGDSGRRSGPALAPTYPSPASGVGRKSVPAEIASRPIRPRLDGVRMSFIQHIRQLAERIEIFAGTDFGPPLDGEEDVIVRR